MFLIDCQSLLMNPGSYDCMLVDYFVSLFPPFFSKQRVGNSEGRADSPSTSVL